MTVNPLADRRRAKVEQYSQAAEAAWRRGDLRASDELFSKAAIVEETVALGVPEGSPRTRSVLAISAVALWYKAHNFERAKRTAYSFLAAENGLTAQGRAELEALVDRCSRDAELAKLGHDPKMVPIEIKLDGGHVASGIAPASVVRSRSAAGVRVLVRLAELEAELPYRERGESELAADDQIEIYEAPALAASYGLRLYVATGTQQNIPSEQRVAPERVVERFLELAAVVNTEHAGEAIRTKIADPQYARSVLDAFAEIAPDGVNVGRVVCSSPSWKINAPPMVFEPKHRHWLRSAAPVPLPDEVPNRGTGVEGTLLNVTLKRGDCWKPRL